MSNVPPEYTSTHSPQVDSVAFSRRGRGGSLMLHESSIEADLDDAFQAERGARRVSLDTTTAAAQAEMRFLKIAFVVPGYVSEGLTAANSDAGELGKAGASRAAAADACRPQSRACKNGSRHKMGRDQ
jgi:hypothetical protein